MKLQCGVLYWNGRSAGRADLRRMLGEFEGRSFETAGEVFDGQAAMAYRGDRITDEEDLEVQPFRLGPYVLTWDGRLDNREDLGKRLRLRHLEAVPDPEMVLQAYDAFGEAIFCDLIGEFALTLWCSGTKSMQFVRSACGARPLYYVFSKDALTWSSDFAHLVRVSKVDLTVNDDYVIQYLVAQPSAKESPLVHVHPVPPNQMVRIEVGQVKYSHELWNPTRIKPLRYRMDSEYEEHCREKIEEAVRVRLRSKHLVFAELSGGLDSSTVVLTADSVLGKKNESPTKLQTISYVYELSQSCDERRFIQAVIEKRGVDSLFIHEEDQRVTTGLEEPAFTGLPNALHCFPGRYERAMSFMRQYQSRILLTGLGGDHLFWSEPDGSPLLADELRHTNVVEAYRQLRTWGLAAGRTSCDLLVNTAVPLAIESFLPRRSTYKRPELPMWMRPEHRERLLSTIPNFEGFAEWREAPSRRSQVFMVDHMFRYTGSGFLQEYADIYGSHPYSHRPLVEFCLACPLSQFLRDGQTRSLMRRSLAHLLPAKTIKRNSKGLLDETIVRAVNREWNTITEPADWEVCKRGYVGSLALEDSLRKARLGLIYLTGPLIRLFSLERWLRSLGRIRFSVDQSTMTETSLSSNEIPSPA